LTRESAVPSIDIDDPARRAQRTVTVGRRRCFEAAERRFDRTVPAPDISGIDYSYC
jgi:hypothetical protein